MGTIKDSSFGPAAAAAVAAATAAAGRKCFFFKSAIFDDFDRFWQFSAVLGRFEPFRTVFKHFWTVFGLKF